MDIPNENKEEDVYLYLYDISNGFATKVAKFMTGRDIEAIYHSSLVLFGREYYFSGGIQRSLPSRTQYGIPLRKTLFGKTTKSKQEFEDYLKSINYLYTEDSYHLLNHNCNHFTNDICNFLCNKPLPDEILNQNKALSDTAFYKWLYPRLENYINIMKEKRKKEEEEENNQGI